MSGTKEEVHPDVLVTCELIKASKVDTQLLLRS